LSEAKWLAQVDNFPKAFAAAKGFSNPGWGNIFL
jgi:hypothetical protein